LAKLDAASPSPVAGGAGGGGGSGARGGVPFQRVKAEEEWGKIAGTGYVHFC